jgi:hypothetical protein
MPNYRSELPFFPGRRNWERKFDVYFHNESGTHNLIWAGMNQVGE